LQILCEIRLSAAERPQRVVSLVPSITESLFDLGFAKSVVGITDFCIHPAYELTLLPRIGGTKNPRVDEIIELQPDVVFANQEENTPAAVHVLQDAGVRVEVNFPLTVEQAVVDLGEIAQMFGSEAAERKVAALREQIATARAAKRSPLRVFCPIWQAETGDGVGWWMTINQRTFTHDMLALCGLENVFATRERRYPLDADLGRGEAQDAGERDTRYPRVTASEIAAAAPQLILLPSEPYAFTKSHVAEMRALFPGAQVQLIDGSLVTWPGTRMGKAIGELEKMRAAFG
jgi:iron complex transport system substrate-binding protein